MTDNTPSVGLTFKLRLDSIVSSTEDLVKLAKETMDVSHDHRTFSEREGKDLIVNPTSIKVGATIGMGRAIMNKNLSTNDKLYMIMNPTILGQILVLPLAIRQTILSVMITRCKTELQNLMKL